MGQALMSTLRDHLGKARRSPYTLAYRVAIANQLTCSSIWHMLNVWTGNRKQLQAFDNHIRDFIWSGEEFGKKPRVDYETLKRALDNGGRLYYL